MRGHPLDARDPTGQFAKSGAGAGSVFIVPPEPAAQCPPGYYYDPILNQCVQGYRYHVCCRTLRGSDSGGWLAKQCGYLHCEVSAGPCPAVSPTTPWIEYPMYPDPSNSRTLDDGTPCDQATWDQIAACIKRQTDKHDAMPKDRLLNSCQHYAVSQIGACCLRSTWEPDWAGERPCIRGHYETIRRIRKDGCGFDWITEEVFICDEYLPEWRDPKGTVPIY